MYQLKQNTWPSSWYMKETTEDKFLPSPHTQHVSTLGKQPEGFLFFSFLSLFIGIYVPASASHAPSTISCLCLKKIWSTFKHSLHERLAYWKLCRPEEQLGFLSNFLDPCKCCSAAHPCDPAQPLDIKTTLWCWSPHCLLWTSGLISKMPFVLHTAAGGTYYWMHSANLCLESALRWSSGKGVQL